MGNVCNPANGHQKCLCRCVVILTGALSNKTDGDHGLVDFFEHGREDTSHCIFQCDLPIKILLLFNLK